jgi:hypothetical protein
MYDFSREARNRDYWEDPEVDVFIRVKWILEI